MYVGIARRLQYFPLTVVSHPGAFNFWVVINIHFLRDFLSGYSFLVFLFEGRDVSQEGDVRKDGSKEGGE